MNRGFDYNEQECVDQLELTLEHMDVEDKSNMFVSCIRLMAIAETFQDITGERRKELVMMVIRNNLPQTESYHILPSFMDTIINVEKGKIGVSLPQNTRSGWLDLLFKACLSSKK